MYHHRAMQKIIFLLALASSTFAQSRPYANYSVELHVPFSEGSQDDQGFEDNVHVRLKLSSPDSRTIVPFVDTGSCGIVLSTDQIKGWDGSEANDVNVGWQYLSSSNWLYNGHWVVRNVYLKTSNDGDAREVQVTVPILAVTKKLRCPSYDISNPGKDCPGGATEILSNPTGIRILGIGYGREGDGQPHGTPDKNPFLHVTAIDGRDISSFAYRPGFIISPDGITLGLTSDDTADMTFASLANASVGPQWDLNYRWPQLPACITIAGPGSSIEESQPCIRGQALLDTGVGQAFLRVPQDSPSLPRDSDSQTLLDDTQIEIAFGSPVAATERFTVGQPGSPDSVRAVYANTNNPRPPFINTARAIYRRYKVAFDPVLGRVGFGNLY